MQILIAGATGTGKTTLALEISKQHPSYIVSTADIREAIKIIISEDITPEMFHSTYKLRTIFSRDSPQSMIEKQAEPILKATAAILNKHRSDNIVYIVEGIHILPLILKYLNLDEFLVLLLHQPSEEQHWQWLQSRAQINKAKPISKYESYFYAIRDLGEYIQNAWLSIGLQESQFHTIYNINEGTEKALKFLQKF